MSDFSSVSLSNPHLSSKGISLVCQLQRHVTKSQVIMTEALPVFKYSPLIGEDSIRLLVVQPAQPGSIIQCDLIHTTIAECHDEVFDHYTALSYVWGDAKYKRTIYVDSLAFEVPRNLFDALDDIRNQQRSLRLWADAICIDQSNFEERSSQVALMRRIYSLASFTIIYLGE